MKELTSMSDYVLLGLEEASILYGTKEINRIFCNAFSNSSLRVLAIKTEVTAHGSVTQIRLYISPQQTVTVSSLRELETHLTPDFCSVS